MTDSEIDFFAACAAHRAFSDRDLPVADVAGLFHIPSGLSRAMLHDESAELD